MRQLLLVRESSPRTRLWLPRVDDWIDSQSQGSLDAAKASTALHEDSLDEAASVSSAAFPSATSGTSAAARSVDAKLQVSFRQLNEQAAASGWSPAQLSASQSARLRQVVVELQVRPPKPARLAPQARTARLLRARRRRSRSGGCL